MPSPNELLEGVTLLELPPIGIEPDDATFDHPCGSGVDENGNPLITYTYDVTEEELKTSELPSTAT